MTNIKRHFYRENIHNTNSYLMIMLGFFLPLSVSIATIILGLILLFWLYEGKFSQKLSTIKNNPITYAFLAFFFVHVLGLLWTENLEWGLHIVGKEWRILALIILITITKKEHIKYYITSFLLAMSLSEIISYSIWFKIIDPFKSATIDNPTPFMSHVSYNPFLAFTIYLLGYFILFGKVKNKIEYLLSSLFVLSMTINMFITGGRAGQVGFFVAISILAIQYFKKDFIKIILIMFIALPSVFFLAYFSSNIFHDRINLAVKEISSFKENPNTNVGLRLTFLFNSLEIIKNNPLIGVGTGDFPNEYKIVSEKNTPKAMLTNNPHNMYTLVGVQTGILGLITLLSIFYTQIKLSFKQSEYSEIKLALPLIFLVIMLSDSYLLGHYTTMLFIYFSAFLYKDYELNIAKILIVIRRSNGDVFLSSPLIEALHVHYNNPQIDLLVNDDTLAIAKCLPHINHIYTFSYEKKKNTPLKQEFSIIKSIYKKYDLSINLIANDRSVMYSILASSYPISAVEQESKKSWWKKLFLKKSYLFDNSRHILKNNTASLDLLNIPNDSLHVKTYYPQTSKDTITQKLNKLKIEKFIIFHPSAQYEYKIYPKDLRDKLLELLNDLNIPIVITGANSALDKKIKTELPKLKNIYDFIGETTPHELLALNDLSLAYIGMDTLNMHIAAASNKEVFAIFGPTKLAMWSPWSNSLQCSTFQNKPKQTYGNITIFQANMPCVACGLAGCDDKHGKSDCLYAINPKTIFTEVKRCLTK